MRSIPKIIGIVSSGIVLGMWLFVAAQAEDMKAAPSVEPRQLTDKIEKAFSEMQETRIIQGDVLRVEGTNYFVKRLDGKEMAVQVDKATVQTGDVKAGDRIEAKIDTQNRALSIRPAP